MKRTLIFIFAALFSLGITARAADTDLTVRLQIGNPVMKMNGGEYYIDDDGTAPVVVNDRTLLPVRAVVEAMGGTVGWDDASQTASLECDGNTIELTIGSGEAKLNGEAVGLDTAPEIINGRTMLPIRFIAESFKFTVAWDESSQTVTVSNKPGAGMIIVLDPGHGKDSGRMSEEEKAQSGWTYNSAKGGWGEWRHFKYGTLGPDCEGEGCSHRVTSGGACWYPIGYGDRDTEPAINLSNCLAAKAYLEQMGYTVRLTRSSNEENPSITRRLEYCYPNNDTSQQPDAAMFVCVHSNAGGGSGSSYISLAGDYDQPTTLGSSAAYVEAGNALGQSINEKIGEMTALRTNGPLDFEPELIAFCKAPVICGYMEIGFFDNSYDLDILTSSSDAIGNAIASGIDSFVHGYMGI